MTNSVVPALNFTSYSQILYRLAKRWYQGLVVQFLPFLRTFISPSPPFLSAFLIILMALRVLIEQAGVICFYLIDPT